MTELAQKRCVPCSAGSPPLSPVEQKQLLERLDPGWRVVEGHHLDREYRFHDFREALAFTNAVGEIAEAEGHHPDIHLAWGLVRITLWTHKIGGLSENDFVLAAKVDRLPR